MSNYSNEWETAKGDYHRLTGEKKPRESFLKFFSTSHTGISSSLEALTTKWDDRSPKDRTPQKYAGLLEDYKKAKEKYVKTLSNLIRDESKKSSEVKPTDMLKGLEMLRAKLDKFEDSFTVKLSKLNYEAAQLSDEDRLKAAYIIVIKKGFSHFSAAAKSIAVTPTPEVYLRELKANKGVEKLVSALEARKKTTGDPAEKEKAQKWIGKLSPWVSDQLNPVQGKDQVLKQLKEVSTIVSECSKDLRIG